MMAVDSAPLLRGLVKQSSSVDNATATATIAAIAAQTHLVLGVQAHYTAAVTAIKTITLTVDGVATVFRHDFTNGAFAYNFPVALSSGTPNVAVTCALEASGTGGTFGQAIIWYAEK